MPPVYPPDQGHMPQYAERGSRSAAHLQQRSNTQTSDYHQQHRMAMDEEDSRHHENGGSGVDVHGNIIGSRQYPPNPGPIVDVDTTAISRQNSTSSNASSALAESSEERLRQTLSANGQPHSDGRQSRKKNASSSHSLATTFNGHSDHPAMAGAHDDNYQDFYEFDRAIARHGFEDEYNSEAYLALLEQVRGAVPVKRILLRGIA